MRKIIYLFAIGSFIMFGCSKEETNEQVFNNSTGNVKLITLSDGNRTTLTMLEFSDINAYETTLADLEEKLEMHDDSFIQEYGYLDDEALNDKEEEIGFNDQLPLIEFENQLGFQNSMRKAFVIAEKEWLNNEVLDPATDPSNTYVFGNAEMALLNEGGEVKIGKSLLKLTKDGFVEITDGDMNKLVRFDNGDMSVLDEPNVKTNLDEASRSANCKSWKGEDNTDKYSSDKKVIKHEHFHAYPWKGTSEAQITSYKKRGSGWVKYRMNLGVANQSYFYDNDCGSIESLGWTGWKRKKKKSISQHFASRGAFPAYRAKNNVSVIGFFEYAGKSNYDVLSW